MKLIRIGVAMFSILLAGCRPNPGVELEKAMQRYDTFIQAMNADSIAATYTENGKLGETIVGRDSIRNFLNGFQDVKVLDCRSSVDSSYISSNEEVAYLKGQYWQTVIVKNDTLRLKGIYKSNWKKSDRRWLIEKMLTVPSPE
jgi:hypothetical protein